MRTLNAGYAFAARSTYMCSPDFSTASHRSTRKRQLFKIPTTIEVYQERRCRGEQGPQNMIRTSSLVFVPPRLSSILYDLHIIRLPILCGSSSCHSMGSFVISFGRVDKIAKSQSILRYWCDHRVTMYSLTDVSNITQKPICRP